VKTVDAKPVPEPKVDDGDKATKPIAAASPPAVNRPSVPAAATPPASVAKEAVPEAAPAEVTDKPKQPAVAMDDLEIKHDPGKKDPLGAIPGKKYRPPVFTGCGPVCGGA
jgi:hypothetical protein